jgi:hypothetical protein
MSSDARRPLAFALTTLALLALAGCGKKGDPRPAPRTIPAAVADLSVRQRGFEVVLEMTHPKTTVAGLALPPLDEVVLYELQRPAPVATAPVAPIAPSVPADTAAPGTAPVTTPAPPAPVSAAPVILPDRREFTATAKESLRIGGAELASAISGDRITLRFRLPEPVPASPPQRFYAVRTHAAGGETSDLSNLVALLPREVPAAPSDFRARAAKAGIELGWKAPAGAVAGYNLYRRNAEVTGYGPPLATLDAAALAHGDTSAVYGQRYIYAVTAVAGRDPLVESALSVEHEIAYDDRFAPVAPKGLTALPMPGEVKLLWEAVAEPDVAGYLVERADPGSGFHRVNAEPVNALELADRGLGSGFTFRYRVAAIDRSGNLGEFSPAVEVRVP